MVVNKSHIHNLKMSPREVERFQTLLIERSGLLFEGRRVRELERSIATRMIELGVSSFEEYYSFLSGTDQGEEELNRLVISLTVGETQFFRTPDQFAALRKYILPELLDRKSDEKKLLFLSAGCSTGEEPYTLAILLRELLSDFDSWKVDIRACDINRDFLEVAREGVYPERKLRLVDPATRQRYFHRIGGNRWQVKDFLKNDVSWFHHNIIADDMARLTDNREAQVLLCRNVLIYFTTEVIQKVIKDFYNRIEKQGYLMLGYSESLFKINDSFQPVHTPEAFLYQKTSRPAVREKRIPEHAGPLERNELLKALGSTPHPRASARSNAVADRQEPGREPLQETAAFYPREGRERKAKDRPATSEEDKGLPPAPPAGQEPERMEDELWKEALGHFCQENFEEAGERFERMLEHNPSSARAHLGMGFICANRGEEDMARELARKAWNLDDLMPGTYFLLALLEERSGPPEDAIKDYQRAILLDPDFAMAHFNLAHLYLKLGREKDAAREFSNTVSILERDPDNFSLNFSGGLSREAVISFCRMQLEDSSVGAGSGADRLSPGG
ncbi:MAG: CheR family methyltransferase [bacterium]